MLPVSPRTAPITVTNAATVTVPMSASQKRPGTPGGGFPVRMSQKVTYHRSDRPSGGKVSVSSELKVVITTITMGRYRNAKVASAQMRSPTPPRSRLRPCSTALLTEAAACEEMVM